MSQRVLITGGASGLGLAIARAVHEGGGSPFVLDRQRVDDLPFRSVDLADADSTAASVDAAIEQLGGLDAVVTAAGMDACGPLEKVSPADWERVITVNLFGTVRVVRRAMPALRQSGGKVITCASTLGLRALPDASAYCASKFAVVGFTRALAAEMGNEIGVTLLVPGGMRTAFFDGREAKYQPGPDADLQDPVDVARAVMAVLAQPRSAQMREVIITSGGESSWP